ncbi:MAG: hypothetical protein ABI855_11675 [Bacteroidota bacterium]
MSNDQLNQWLDDAGNMISESARVDDCMKSLQKELHKEIAGKIFALFPFLPDKMEPEEIRLLGERISRHLYMLSEEIKNIAFTVECRQKEC